MQDATASRALICIGCVVTALAAVKIVAFAPTKAWAQAPTPPLSRRMTCELTNISGLSGWSPAAQAYWRDRISDAVSERIGFFMDTGRFEPRVYTLNGNIAALSSGTFHRERVDTTTGDADKVQTGTVPGTEVPIYQIRADTDRRSTEIIMVRDASYRLPVRARDLPVGARETILFGARCEVGSGPLIARSQQGGRVVTPIATVRRRPTAPQPSNLGGPTTIAAPIPTPVATPKLPTNNQ